MLELATLGLLQKESLNGYRLKQQLELFMGSCISANYGAIYPLLKRLEERGDIAPTGVESRESGQSGRLYTVTSRGRGHWHEMMLEHPRESWVNSRSRFLIKFFFFNHLEPGERVQLIEHRLMVCRLRLSHRKAAVPLSDRYRELAWQRSLEMLRSEIDWLTQQLQQEQQSSVAEKQYESKRSFEHTASISYPKSAIPEQQSQYAANTDKPNAC